MQSCFLISHLFLSDITFVTRGRKYPVLLHITVNPVAINFVLPDLHPTSPPPPTGTRETFLHFCVEKKSPIFGQIHQLPVWTLPLQPCLTFTSSGLLSLEDVVG